MLSLRTADAPSFNCGSRQQLLPHSCIHRQLGSSTSRPAANRAFQASSACSNSTAAGVRLGWPMIAGSSRGRRCVRAAASSAAAKGAGSEVRLGVTRSRYVSGEYISLTTAELLKYPDSLLSVNGLAKEGSSYFYFSDTGSSLIKEWPEAFDVILNLYRDGAFPIEFLEQQLAECRRDMDMWPSLDALHTELEDLLSLLKLPGRVVDWIPWQTCTVCHPKVLELTAACLAKDAVKLMMGHMPLSQPLGVLSGGMASFVVVADSDGLSLSVYFANTTDAPELSKLLHELGPKGAQAVRMGSSAAEKGVKFVLLPDGGAGSSVEIGQLTHFVGSTTPGLGDYLTKALEAAAAANGLTATACMWEGPGAKAPLWVVWW